MIKGPDFHDLWIYSIYAHFLHSNTKNPKYLKRRFKTWHEVQLRQIVRIALNLIYVDFGMDMMHVNIVLLLCAAGKLKLELNSKLSRLTSVICYKNLQSNQSKLSVLSQYSGCGKILLWKCTSFIIKWVSHWTHKVLHYVYFMKPFVYKSSTNCPCFTRY